MGLDNHGYTMSIAHPLPAQTLRKAQRVDVIDVNEGDGQVAKETDKIIL